MSGISHPPLPSSQTQVFAGEKGKPLLFFVEATAVRGRPALIRKIIKNGGSVVNSAREANILLAEHSTKEALELFEAWRGDKILLSTRWVGRCLEEHAFLGGDHGWAGCEFTREILLEGIFVGDDEDDEAEEAELSQHTKRPRLAVTSSQTFKSSPSKSGSQPGLSRLKTTTKTSPSQSGTHAEWINDQMPPNFPANTQHPIFQSPRETSLHAPQMSTIPIDTSIQTSHSSPQTTIHQQQQVLLATMLSNLIQPSQQSHSPDIFSSLAQYSNFPQPLPLFPPTLQHYLAQQLAGNPLALNSGPTEVVEQLEQPGLGNMGQQLSGFDAPSGSTQESSTRPTPEDVDTGLVSDIGSVPSEKGEVKLSKSRRHRGKGQATSDSSDGHVETAVRSNPPLKENPPRKLTGIFVNGQGMPQQFYVMVDIKNRKNLLKIIRKHNGTIVTKMSDAEYIILNNRSNQFQKALELLPSHKIALSPAWLEQCENMGKMVNTTPHVIDVMSGVRQGALRWKPKPSKAPASVPEECESEEDASRPTGIPDKTLPTKSIQCGITSDPRTRSQSPLPPTNIITASHGRHLFTEEDQTWFFNYARFKLQRNPNMSHNALIRGIAHKAPHHSVKSWAFACRSKWRNELEALKREMASLREQPVQALPSLSSPTTPRDRKNELLYPDISPTLVPSQSSPSLPPSNASIPRSPQAESICTTPLKRKEPPSEEEQDTTLTVDQPNKKLKTMDIIDVDSLCMVK